MTRLHSENLFRHAAVAALASRLGGRPIARLPRPWLWLAALCVLMAVSMLGFARTNEYARKESVRGWLVSDPGVIRLTHNVSATVERIVKNVGDALQRGEPILYLSTDMNLGNGAAATTQILEQLLGEVAETEARDVIARQNFASVRAGLTRQVDAIDAELHALQGQVRDQEGRVAINANKLSRLQVASKGGAISAIELLRHRDELTTLQQSLGRLQQERERVRRERQQLIAALDRVSIELDSQLSSSRSERSVLRRRITAQEGQRLLAVQSPIDGVLATLDLVAGTTVRPQQLLATVLPHDYALAADVYIPSRAIGLVRPGQEVRLRYDAFPHQQFGTATGHVEAITGYVLLPGDVPPTFSIREATYKARVRIERDYVDDHAGRYGLRPGMLLAAEILLESRTVADWLLAPLRLNKE